MSRREHVFVRRDGTTFVERVAKSAISAERYGVDPEFAALREALDDLVRLIELVVHPMLIGTKQPDGSYTVETASEERAKRLEREACIAIIREVVPSTRKVEDAIERILARGAASKVDEG